MKRVLCWIKERNDSRFYRCLSTRPSLTKTSFTRYLSKGHECRNIEAVLPGELGIYLLPTSTDFFMTVHKQNALKFVSVIWTT